VTEGAALEALERIRKAMRVTRRVALGVCEGVVQPVLVGIVRPMILLPGAALTGWSAEELEMVLVHELAHVRRWDNLVNLVQRLVESALFFHPAVWLASRQVRRDREECCDAAVVAYTRRPTEYAELLVSIAARGPRGRAQRAAKASLAFASAMADHPLAGRIRRILKLEDEPMWVSRSTLGLVFVLGASLLAAVVALPPTGGANADDASTPSPVAAATDGGEEEAQNAVATGDVGGEEGSEGAEAATQTDAARANTFEATTRTVAAPKDRSAAASVVQDAPAVAGHEIFLEYELPKLKSDIALYQSQLFALQKEQEDIEVLKDVALQTARSPSALEAAVEADVRHDPTIAKHQQQLFELQQAIQQQMAAGGAKSSRLQELTAQKNHAEAQLKQYKDHAEQAARDRLAKVPNEALRAAMAEYTIRAKSIADRKAELERKLKTAEARVAELKAAGGDASARSVDGAATTYAAAAGSDIDLAQVQDKIRIYRQAILAQQKEAADLDVQQQMDELRLQRAAHIDAQVEQQLSNDRRAKAFEEDAIVLEKKLRAMRGEGDAESRDQYERAEAQYEALVADAERYRQDAAEKYRSRYEDLAKEMAEASRQEFAIKAKALQARRAELAEQLEEAEAQLAKLAKQAAAQRAPAGGQNPYWYSTRPQFSAESAPAASGAPKGDQPPAPAAAAAARVGPNLAQPRNPPSRSWYWAEPRAVAPTAANAFAEPATPVEAAQPAPTQNLRHTSAADPNSAADPLTPPHAPRSRYYYDFTADPRMQPVVPPAQRKLQPYDAIRVEAAGVLPEQPLADQFQVEEAGTVPLGPTYGRVKVAGMTVLEAQEAIEKKLEKVVQDAEVQVVLAGPAIVWGQSTPAAPAGTQLTYDGKTFDQWQSLVRTELNPERRAEAVEALAAFGRAGRGRDAAIAIFEIADQYSSPEVKAFAGRLQGAVIVGLTKSIPADIWLPMLYERFVKDLERWQDLALALEHVSPDGKNKQLKKEMLLSIARHGAPNKRYPALLFLIDEDRRLSDVELTSTVSELLHSDDPQIACAAVRAVSFAERYPPELFDVLMRDRNAAQQAALELIRSRRRSEVVTELRDKVAAALDEMNPDETPARQAAPAIQALAAFGASLDSAELKVRRWLGHDDQRVRQAAQAGLQEIARDREMLEQRGD
jgi:hypothetical protein